MRAVPLACSPFPCALLASVLLSLGVGCSLEDSVLAGDPDGASGRDVGGGDGARDAARDSETSPADARPDTASSDTGAAPDTATPVVDAGRDTALPDTAPPDTAPPDTAPPDTGTTSACDARYGGAFGYELCRETASECEFYTNLEGIRTCEGTCASLGGRCIRQWRNNPGAPDQCAHADFTARPCDVVGINDDICVCEI